MGESSKVTRSVAELRREEMQVGLKESDLSVDPFEQFAVWFARATEVDIFLPNAMALATANRDGRPSVRMVLLKGFDERGFVFFTNYESRKGRELAENPWGALVFNWVELARQVRISGQVSKVTHEESEAYFHSRSRGSQIGAAASFQSQVLPHRDALEQRIAELTEEYADGEIPLPDYWGGYRMEPDEIEFWQERPDRVHDRLRYRRQPGGGWVIDRLSP